jgi:hypothetical protein
VWDVFNQYSLGVIPQRLKVPEELAKLTGIDRILASESGVNYVLAQMMFGNLSFEQASNSMGLFAREVAPAFAARAGPECCGGVSAGWRVFRIDSAMGGHA